MLTIVFASSYIVFREAKNTCEKNNGTVTKQDLNLLAFHWSFSCERDVQ